MEKKAVSGIMLTLLLISMLALAFNIQRVKAGTIIVPDDYPTIQQAINAASPRDTIYVKAGVYYEKITVNKALWLIGEDRHTTIIDGMRAGDVIHVTSNDVSVTGFTIRNSSLYWLTPYSGIHVETVSGLNISKNNIIDNGLGIHLRWSSNNTIARNDLISNYVGVRLYRSSNNTLVENNMIDNRYGIELRYSSSNNLIGNNIIKNRDDGIWLHSSSNNVVYHNNFINNIRRQVSILEGSLGNVWDDDYPSGGNYWSNYTGVDEKSGPNQDQLGSDGIGDTPHVIDADNRDRYPLMRAHAPRIIVTSPNGGETWLVGSHQFIQWIGAVTGNVSIKLSTDSGSTWKEPLFASTVNDGVENWRVMAYPGNQLMIRVASLDDLAVSDMSDGNFSITTVSTTNTFPVGYCTWWTYERRAQFGIPVDWLNDMPRPRHAYKWIDFAKQVGVPTGSEPRSGAIAVWGATPTNSFGHVAIVEWMEPGQDEFWTGISEMNYGSFVDPDEGITVNFMKVTDRTLTLPRPPEENFLGFIYGAAIPDFSITAFPTSLTIQQGNSDTSIITITSINGFDQPVQLVVSGAPSGVTTTLDPEQVTSPPDGSTTSTITVSAATTVTPGSYTLTVTGTSGTLTHSVDVSLEITALPAIAKPVITSPLEITPKGPYYVGDTLTAKFTIKNIGNAPITLDKLLVGGRFNDGKLPNGEYPDFTSQSLTLQPGESHQYEGTLKLTEPGNYHFFCAYYIENPTEEERKLLDENNWNTSIDLGEALTDEYRIEDITVKEQPPEGQPHIHSIVPSSGAPGIEVTIKGINFSPKILGPRVMFGMFTEATIISKDEREIVVIIPPGEGTVDVTVEVDFTVSNKVPFTYEEPVIKAIYPSSGIPGTQVTIEGENFGFQADWPATGRWHVKFGKSLARIISWEDTRIVVEAPSDYGTGINDVKFLTKIVSFGIQDLWGKVIGILADLFIPGIALAPTEDGILEDVVVVTPAGMSNKATFTWKTAANIETSNLYSPGELRVYDSQGRVTGLVNGEEKNEIPHSHYYENAVIIFSTSDSYYYEIVGTDEGKYRLEVASITKNGNITLTAEDIPTSPNVIHRYTIDWGALSRGEEGVTVKVDSDGDGVFELTFTSDNELTQDEFMLQFPSAEAFPMWIVGVAVAIIAIAAVAIAVFWRRRKQPPIKG